MKNTHFPKILTFLTLLVMGAMNASAQTISFSSAYLEASVQNVTSGGVVRDAGPMGVLSCGVSQNGCAMFTLVNSAGTIWQKEIDDAGFVVNDFQIYRDEVFVCGRYRMSPMVGTFSISDLSPSVNYPRIRYQIYDTLDELHRLEVYPDPTSARLHMVMLGRRAPGNPAHYTMIAECDYNFVSDEFEQYSCASVSHWIDDIIVTGQYVVFTESGLTSQGFHLRRCGKFPVLTSPACDQYYFFPCANEPSIQRFIGTLIRRDTIAVACPEDAVDGWKMHVHTIDIANMDMVSSMYFDLETKATPVEMVYLELADSLVLDAHYASVLHNGVVSELIAISPRFSNHYIAGKIFKQPMPLINSLSAVSNRGVIAVAQGSLKWLYKDYTLVGNNGSCPQRGEQKIWEDSPVRCKLEPSPLRSKTFDNMFCVYRYLVTVSNHTGSICVYR